MLFRSNELRLVLEPDGYAVVGIAGENAYVLDLVADEGSMPQLWARIETMGKSIHMNVPSGSPPQKWLTRELQWKLPGKPLAMWLPMTDLGRQQRFGEFYIPLLSRI